MSDLSNILKKVKRYEVRIRKALDAFYQGEHISMRKGSGIEFDDTREYQYGDEVRNIHWKLSAKGHGTYIKTFREEKEQIVFFIVDVSGSLGIQGDKKLQLAKELCALLSLSSLHENSQVGLLLFSDKKETLIPLSKHSAQFMRIWKALCTISAGGRTDLSHAFQQSLSFLKQISMVIVISDFIDDNYENSLRALSKRHDVILLHIWAREEVKIPPLGIIPVQDSETEKAQWVNMLRRRTRESFQVKFQDRQHQLASFAKKYDANYVAINTEDDYCKDLIALFKQRNLQA